MKVSEPNDELFFVGDGVEQYARWIVLTPNVEQTEVIIIIDDRRGE